MIREYLYLALFCALFSVVLVCAVDMPWEENNQYPGFPYTTFCFLVGATTSMIAGYVGMMIATSTNVKVTYLCNRSIDEGFMVAFNGGQVLGFVLVGLALGILEILILVFKPSVLGFIGEQADQATIQRQVQIFFEMISGYGLGGSTVALFGRVGGGI